MSPVRRLVDVTGRRERLADALAVGALYAAACALVRAGGFDHVSDDDFARVTIAQAFAHAPRLDPSGTSWLPFPFWALGSVLAVAGRSLAIAHAASVALAAAAAPLPYLAMRAVGVSRLGALAGVALALLSPWPLWLGAATVPESFTASAATAATIALGAARTRLAPRAAIGFAAALLAACLSRYEPWPVAAVLGPVLATRAARGPRGGRMARVVLILLAIAGPLAWLLWNAHAHGSAVHFLHRVASYRRGIGEGTRDVMDALALYPGLLARTRPELLLALVVAAPSLVSSAELRARWTVPLSCALAQLAFLAYGAVQDGAPTHHAERALLGATFIAAAFIADALASASRALFAPDAPAERRGLARLVAGAGALAWALSLRPLLDAPPGTSAHDHRSAQVARGLELRGAPRLVVTPCAYEHFALIAAYGAPERVDVRPRTNAPVTAACPHVEAR